MSDYRIETDEVQITGSQLSELNSRIYSLKGQINALSGQLNLHSSSTNGIRRNLRAIATACDQNAEDISRLQTALEEIVELYEKTEKSVMRNAGADSESVRSHVERLRGEIEEIGGILGMDTAALFSDDPVNLSNGNYVYENTFLEFDTILPMKFRMFYNACSENSGVLGKGWTHNFELQLHDTGDQLRILSEDGSARVFLRNADGGFIACPGTVGTLTTNDYGWFFRDDQQDCYCFDISGRFLAVENPDGWRIDLIYGLAGLEKASCTDGVALMFAYDASGSLTCIQDHTGRRVSFGYENESLVCVQDPAGSITRYVYDECGRMCQITAPDGNLSVRNTFDKNGRTVQQEFADGGVVTYCYDADAVTMVRQNGSKVTYYHDALFRNTRTVYPDGEEQITYNDDNMRTSFTDRLGRVSRYGYDGARRLSEIINAAGHRMSMGYNEAGQLSRVLLDGELIHQAQFDMLGHQLLSTNANGESCGFEYDEKGRLKAVIHEDGSRTELEYDGQGNVIRVHDSVTGSTCYRYDACRRVISSTDALDNETRYEYDTADRLTKVINACGDSRSYHYDRRGNLTRIVDFNGGVTEVAYNAMNRPVCITDPDGKMTRFEYDSMSNMIRKTAADGGVTEVGYDTEGRMTSIRYPSGAMETAQYDAAGNMTLRCAPDGGVYRFTYDELDRPVSVTDPVGGVRSATYDNLSNVTSVTYEDGTQEFFTYDKMGNRLAHTDQIGHTRYFQYSPLGKLTRIFDDEGILAQLTYGPGGQLLRESRADGGCVEYSYDPAGNVIRVTDNVQGVWNFRYDALGRMHTCEHVGVGTEFYEYDSMGNISAVVDGEGNRTAYCYSKAGALEKVTDAKGSETMYRYDGCYRLLKILRAENGRIDAKQLNEFNQEQRMLVTSYEWNQDGNLTSVQDNAGCRTSYQYDPCGRILRRQDPDGNVTACTYRLDGTEDLLTFADGRSVRYQYDALKRLAQIEDWLGVTRISRDDAGRIVEVVDHEDNTTCYTWNTRGQCSGIRYPDGQRVRYTYDRAMRLSGLTSGENWVHYDYNENGLLRGKQLTQKLSVDYGYDAAGRIGRLSYFCDGAETDCFEYAYDACSRKNRIAERHAGTPEVVYGFRYDSVGCLTDVTRNDRGWQHYDYDVFGNRIRTIRDGETTFYDYDALGRLSNSRCAGIEKVYTYDNRGNLTGETVNGHRRLTLHFDALDRLAKATSDCGEAAYTYNGMAMLTEVRSRINGQITEEHRVFDYVRSQNRLLAHRTNGNWENCIWDWEPVLACGADQCVGLLNDERMTGFGFLSGDTISRRFCDSFGVAAEQHGKPAGFGFTGYRHDPVTGYYDAGWRQYDASVGRFISQDPMAGFISVPVSLNPYIYCMSDPVNRLDPTGMIVAWLAGGIVGTVINVGVKFAGDVVNSVAAGEWRVSSWQSYLGTAAGGFVQGSVFVVAGPGAAGAAGAATETLITNGLNMATGVEGYRSEDGYGVGNLLWDTGKSAAGGAVSGFTFGAAAKYLKIPHITAGRGNASAVWQQVMTKAARGQIANVTLKTLAKGLLSYGLVRTADTIISEGIDAVKEWTKEKGLELLRAIFSGSTVSTGTSLMSLFSSRTATCATT